MGVGSLSQG